MITRQQAALGAQEQRVVTPTPVEVLEAVANRKKHEDLYKHGHSSQENVFQAKLEETKLVLTALYPPGMITENVPPWALEFHRQIMTEFSDMRSLLAQMSKRLLKTENINSMLYTEERLLHEIPNAGGRIPSENGLQCLSSLSVVSELTNEQVREFLAFYGLRTVHSAEVNRLTLRNFLGVPVPRRIQE